MNTPAGSTQGAPYLVLCGVRGAAWCMSPSCGSGGAILLSRPREYPPRLWITCGALG